MLRILQPSFTEKTSKRSGLCLLACFIAALILSVAARATENSGSVYPVGAETVLQGMMPGPHETGLYTFHLLYTPNELDGPAGQSEVPVFHLRVFANAVKIEHNWGIPVLGGKLASTVAVPFLYEQLRIPSFSAPKVTQFGLSNCLLVPVGVTYNKGSWHGFYQFDFYTPGAPYTQAAELNVGQHHLAAGPTGAITYLAPKAAWELSSKVDYIINFTNNSPAPLYNAKTYRNGNELTWEYTGMRAVSKKAALGVNGYLYQQTTNDQCTGTECVVNGKGRDLAIGPEFRYFFGEHKAFAIKYTRDTLVENKCRGNSFWFQLGIPLEFGKKK